MDIRFIGIPYKLHGRNYDGCDCYGLVYLYMKSKGYTLPKYDFSYTLETSKEEITVDRALLLGTKLDEPTELAIVLFYRRSRPVHVGVYTQGGVLHTSEQRDSVFEHINSPKLQRFSKMEYYSVSKSYYTAQSL